MIGHFAQAAQGRKRKAPEEPEGKARRARFAVRRSVGAHREKPSRISAARLSGAYRGSGGRRARARCKAPLVGNGRQKCARRARSRRTRAPRCRPSPTGGGRARVERVAPAARAAQGRKRRDPEGSRLGMVGKSFASAPLRRRAHTKKHRLHHLQTGRKACRSRKRHPRSRPKPSVAHLGPRWWAPGGRSAPEMRTADGFEHTLPPFAHRREKSGRRARCTSCASGAGPKKKGFGRARREGLTAGLAAHRVCGAPKRR